MWYESIPSFAIITGALWGAGLLMKGIHYVLYDEVRRGMTRAGGRGRKEHDIVFFRLLVLSFSPSVSSLFLFSQKAHSGKRGQLGPQDDGAGCAHHGLRVAAER